MLAWEQVQGCSCFRFAVIATNVGERQCFKKTKTKKLEMATSALKHGTPGSICLVWEPAILSKWTCFIPELRDNNFALFWDDYSQWRSPPTSTKTAMLTEDIWGTQTNQVNFLCSISGKEVPLIHHQIWMANGLAVRVQSPMSCVGGIVKCWTIEVTPHLKYTTAENVAMARHSTTSGKRTSTHEDPSHYGSSKYWYSFYPR